MLAWFEHSRKKECVREEFPYVQKPRKDYRLEVKEEENAVKVFGITRPANWLGKAERGNSATFPSPCSADCYTIFIKPHSNAAIINELRFVVLCQM